MLKEPIIKTIKYFDVQSHPLTLVEIAKYLQGPLPKIFSLSEIEGLIKEISEIENVGGFYCLKGRKEIVEQRLKNNFYSVKRLKRASRYLPFARHIPFIKAVALSGSEALNNSKKGSDIDLLVLTKKNRMWLARLFISFYFQILGMRRHNNLIADRFCLNHYIEQGKNLDKDRNIYTAVEYVSLLPFFGAEDVYEFQTQNLPWIKEFLSQPELIKYKNPAASAFQRFFEKLLSGKLGSWLENAASKYQMHRIHIQDYITVEENELSFHPGSKGQQVLKKIQA